MHAKSKKERMARNKYTEFTDNFPFSFLLLDTSIEEEFLDSSRTGDDKRAVGSYAKEGL